MDYLLRDSLMTGAKYGVYDLEWIINALAIDEEGRSHLRRGARALRREEYLQARYYMFRQFTFIAPCARLRPCAFIFRRVLQLLEAGEEVWYAPVLPLKKSFTPQDTLSGRASRDG